MRVHHLNTGTMCPIGRRLVNGTGSIFQRARMVCHCLLIETHDGLALVDTGIGLDDIANPPRLGPKWVRQTTPRLDPAETAVRQVEALGYSKSDVRHLLLTHLDRDHAGGIPDFPNAKVHVHRREHDMAVTRRTPAPKGRYITDQWKHDPQWTFYGEGGEDWFGFKGVRALGDREPDILTIPLPGHSAIAASPCGAATNGCCTPAMPISSMVRCRLRRKCRWCSACFSAAPTWIAPCASKTRSGYGSSRPITAMP